MLLEDDEAEHVPLAARRLVSWLPSVVSVCVSSKGAFPDVQLAVTHVFIVQASCPVFINVKNKCLIVYE